MRISDSPIFSNSFCFPLALLIQIAHLRNKVLGEHELMRCYSCDNYASMAEQSELRPGISSGLAWAGGQPVFGGLSLISDNGQTTNGLTVIQAARLCSERVNRSQMVRLIDSSDYGECPTPEYDGCVKIVTKSYRRLPQFGGLTAFAVVVSRMCAIVPEGYGVGCFEMIGGAGMRRTICYCRGAFCNDTGRIRNKIAHCCLLYVLCFYLLILIG